MLKKGYNNSSIGLMNIILSNNFNFDSHPFGDWVSFPNAAVGNPGLGTKVTHNKFDSIFSESLTLLSIRIYCEHMYSV